MVADCVQVVDGRRLCTVRALHVGGQVQPADREVDQLRDLLAVHRVGTCRGTEIKKIQSINITVSQHGKKYADIIAYVDIIASNYRDEKCQLTYANSSIQHITTKYTVALTGDVVKSLQMQNQHVRRRPDVHLLDGRQVLLAVAAVERLRLRQLLALHELVQTLVDI